MVERPSIENDCLLKIDLWRRVLVKSMSTTRIVASSSILHVNRGKSALTPPLLHFHCLRVRQKPRPINHQRAPSHIAINSKVQHGLRVIPGVTRPAERNPPLGHKVLLLLTSIASNRRHLAGEVARRQSVDTHLQTGSLKVHGQLVGERYGGGFGGVVRELTVLALLGDTGDAGNVEDARGSSSAGGPWAFDGIVVEISPSSLLIPALLPRGDQQRQKRRGRKVIAGNIHLVGPSPVLEILVTEHSLANRFSIALRLALRTVVDGSHAGVVDEEVHALLLGGNLRDDLLDAVFARHVHLDADDGASRGVLCLGFLELFQAAAGDVDADAIGGEGFGGHEP